MTSPQSTSLSLYLSYIASHHVTSRQITWNIILHEPFHIMLTYLITWHRITYTRAHHMTHAHTSDTGPCAPHPPHMDLQRQTHMFIIKTTQKHTITSGCLGVLTHTDAQAHLSFGVVQQGAGIPWIIALSGHSIMRAPGTYHDWERHSGSW